MTEHLPSFKDWQKFATDKSSGIVIPRNLKGPVELVLIGTRLSDLNPSCSIPQGWLFDGSFLVNFPQQFVTDSWQRFVFDTQPVVRTCYEGKGKEAVVRQSRPELVTFDTLSNEFSASLAAQSFKAPDWTTFLVRLKQ